MPPAARMAPSRSTVMSASDSAPSGAHTWRDSASAYGRPLARSHTQPSMSVFGET